MTKKEIAYQLATQYAIIEEEMFEMSARRDEEKKAENLDLEAVRYFRKEVKRLRSNMATVEKSKDLLGINEKQWYDAITRVYIERNPAS